MKLVGTQRITLYLGSFLFLTATLVSLGGLFQTDRLVRRDAEFLHEDILTHNAWLSRVVLALAQARAVPAGTLDRAGGVLAREEAFRVLLSQVALAPEMRPEETLRMALVEDPLLVVPRLAESDHAYRGVVEDLSRAFGRLGEAGGWEARERALEELDEIAQGLQAVLQDRSTVLSQLEATLHARLRAAQGGTARRLRWILLFQLAALLGGIGLLFSAFRAQARQVKELRGLIPICSNCKKIRDDAGFWSRVEAYFQTHADVSFTHGICPECEELLYPELREEGGGVGAAVGGGEGAQETEGSD